jgi:hypothetical protein
VLLRSSCIEALEAVDTLLIYVGYVAHGPSLPFAQSIPSLSHAAAMYHSNLVHTPEETKYRAMRANNIHYVERVGSIVGGPECMRAIGFRVDGEWLRIDDRVVLSEDALGYFEKRLIETQTILASQLRQLPIRHTIDHQWVAVKAAACHSERGKRQTMEVCTSYLTINLTHLQHALKEVVMLLNRMMKY